MMIALIVFGCNGSIRTPNTYRSFILHRNGNKKNLPSTLSSQNASYQHSSLTNESNSMNHHHHHHHSRTIINSTHYPEYPINTNTATALSSQQPNKHQVFQNVKCEKNNHPINASDSQETNEYTNVITRNSSTHKFTNIINNNNSSSSNAICPKNDN
jgi:hypothetical protein